MVLIIVFQFGTKVYQRKRHRLYVTSFLISLRQGKPELHARATMVINVGLHRQQKLRVRSCDNQWMQLVWIKKW